MNLKCIVTISLGVTILTSCASLSRKGSSSFSDSQSPYVKEESTKPKPKSTTATNTKTASTTASTTKTAAPAKDVVVREEKVKNIDANSPDYNFYVIIGSFRIIDNAKNFKAQLVEEGFKPTILENEAGLYRISVAASNDETTARDKIAEIRASYSQYSDVWLLVSRQ